MIIANTYDVKTKSITTNELVIVNVPNYYSISQMNTIHEGLKNSIENFIVLPSDINIDNTSIEELEYIINKLQTFIVTKKLSKNNW